MKGDRLYKRALIEANLSNNADAYAYLTKASNYKNYKAIYALATWYLNGKFVEIDITKGLQLLTFAAENKHPEALYDLGVCYERGIGLDVDLEKAFECYLQASLRGEKQSLYEVGRCYYYGIGVEEDKVIADYWLERAEELGVTE